MTQTSESWLGTVGASLRPSETLAVKSKAAQLRAEGRTIIDLSTGEPDIDTPEHIKQAATEALRQGKTKYTDVVGIKELRDALASKLANENGVRGATAESVIVTNGGKQALHHLFAVTLNPGDEVIVPAPYWVSYPAIITLAGAKPVIVPTSAAEGYRLQPQALARAITPRTKAIVLNSPSNPTGATYSAADFAALAPVLASCPRALIVSDEVYEKVVFSGFSFISCAQAYPEFLARLVTVNAFSKSYSMTGWRVGYACGPKEIISAMGKLQSQTTSNVCAAAQWGALAALQDDQTFLRGMNQSFERRIDASLKVIRETPGLEVLTRPEGAFYLFIRFAQLQKLTANPAAQSAAALVAYLLEQANVAAVPGDAFGDPQAFRISVASADATVAAGVEAINKSIAKLVQN